MMPADALEKASMAKRDDKNFVIEAVKVNGASLVFASERLRNDAEVAKIAIENDMNAFQYASENLRSNKDLVLHTVRMWGTPLEYASEELRNDKQVVVAAIKARASSIQFASNALKSDKFFIQSLKTIDSSIEEWL